LHDLPAGITPEGGSETLHHCIRRGRCSWRTR
jgi:hypothetical protein